VVEHSKGLTLRSPEAYVLRPQPGDVFVLRTPFELDVLQRAYWHDMLRTALPAGVRYVILANGVDLTLVPKDQFEAT
jgi:lysozyme family protein